jgi:anti-sigma regulatory factor (Ser/Thr protein kinase)
VGASVADSIVDILASGEESGAGLARRVGVTRQAIHYHLNRMVRNGTVERHGRGRGTRYVLTADLRRRWLLEGADEAEVWRELELAVGCLVTAPAPTRSILRYAVTEMVNNAIEHSQGQFVEISVQCGEAIAIEIVDDGVGAFAHVRDQRGLPDVFAAVQLLSKGKTTTAPSHHSGEGIFFTSKAVDVFELESSELRWIVDNDRADEGVGHSTREIGTRVRLSVRRDTSRLLANVFGEYTDPETLQFDRTRTIVRLFESGDAFVSRSEAKRITVGLEVFDEVLIDFRDVGEVGQAFVDELFRVWQREHPEVTLKPVNMNPAVEFMVHRGLGTRPPPGS